MTAATKRRTKTKAPYLADLDPRDLLANPRNVRTQDSDLTELRASIAASGVLQALLVVPDDDGHLIVAGHRRAKAAAEALAAGEWPDGMPPTVPCLVRPDLAGVPADQVVSMLIENDQRADLTPTERAVAYAQLELFGLDPSQIAKRTGRSYKHVHDSLRLVTLGEKATAAADAGRLTLDDVAELQEFEDDPQTLEKILKDVDSSWGIKHKAGEERRKRTVKEAVAALRAELESAGVTIVKKPKDGWPYNCQMARLDQLATADGESIDSETVKALDGYGALIEERWDTAEAVIVCLDPEAHGFKRTGHSYWKSPAEIAAKEAAEKAREERRERLKEAATVRRKFLVEKYGSAKGAKTLLVDAMRLAVVAPGFLAHHVDEDLIRDVAGGELDDGLTAGQDRLNRLLVARMIGAQEYNAGEAALGRWVKRQDLIAPWLTRLEADGYELSDAEAAWRTALIAEEEERRREEAEEEAERLRHEAEEEDDEDGVPDVVDVHLPEHDIEPHDAVADPRADADQNAGESEASV
ncbi:ParB/RepB/Spo0J family partition protein [Verrucosispora sp. WMMD1129]|uniref:ParB/RepB/Spo0J family partition protein n=1 Tax=Verrucosispora sp. WMMD1129 TaxID=3016093 RepID=UPI00249A3830|nr:ParB/RepB/Spo0J family partition protein [Verrucosispora sp. WMMD1129]WFE47585.1 ParB/RepB/Spo0J family partition protein [Verrucosispora sp. WMMD1129]